MKKYIYYILSLTLLAVSSCVGIEEIDQQIIEEDKIIITLNTEASIMTRSADTTPEERVDWIDIFIFDENNALHHHEKADKSSSPDYGGGRLVIKKNRHDFDVNKRYFVFLVANSSEDFSSISVLGDLQRVMQTDENLHLSGFGYNDAPVRFLMDGVAYTGATEPTMPMTMVLNDGDLTASTNLKATLRRAAAKIIVNITQGDNVQFETTLEVEDEVAKAKTSGSASYSFYQLPIATSVIAPLGGMGMNNNIKQTTDDRANNDDTFIWNEDNTIKITGYAYANDWSSTEMTKETALILNLPMWWNEDNNEDTGKDGKESPRPNSWFKVPLSKESKFDRNKCYILNIKINAIGAESKSSAIELDDIEYITSDWIETEVNVGTNENAPEYLMLNTDLVKMYNTNFDASSLTFSSSSYIKSITLKDVYVQNEDGTFSSGSDEMKAYYINKFGIKTDLGSTIRNMISATPEANKLNGGITIFSPILQTTEAERAAALAALGPAPENPGEPPIEKPDPNHYVPADEAEPRNPSYGDTYNEYRYYDGYFQIKTYTYTWVNRKWDWSAGDWVIDSESTQRYNNALQDAIEDYLNNNPDYAEKKAAYDRYQAAYQAINASTTSGDTHYNTIRYLEFEVENMTGQTATFRVMQFPIIYINNIQGWYSYRDDFINSNNEKVNYILYLNQSKAKNNYTRCSYNNGWKYNTGSGSSSLFCSKYVQSLSTSGDNQGKSEIQYYYWTYGNNSTTLGSGSVWDYSNDNARMYHVQISSTSNEYTIGRPIIVDENNNVTTDIDNGFTLGTADNAKLVSPSFMLASQLGATQSPGEDDDDMIKAAEHCMQYVEAYKVSSSEEGALSTTVNGQTVYYKEYHDWRLPTAAEIDIIIALQNNSLSMDEVLSGASYWCASGIRNTNVSGATGTGRIRCVRDAN